MRGQILVTCLKFVKSNFTKSKMPHVSNADTDISQRTITVVARGGSTK